MKILVLGDVMGPSGVKAIKERLPKIINDKKVDFVVVNGENAADDGVGISKKNSDDIFSSGADVITSGNHIWDQKETMEFIENEKRLLRPENSIKPVPGEGYGIFKSKNNKKVAVINLMANVFMKKSEDVFETAKRFIEKVKLKENADFIVVDLHGETTSEKMAMAYFFDGKGDYSSRNTYTCTNIRPQSYGKRYSLPN